MEIKYWVACGAILVMGWILKWGFNFVAKQINKKFDEVINSINKMSTTLAEHTLELKHNDDKITGLSGRVRVLEDEIYKVGCFDLLAMENPYNNTEDACEDFMERYPNYELGVFIYGDASGRVKSTSSRVHNYDIIEQKLKKYVRNWSWRVPKRNPLYNKRRDFMNRIMGGGYEDIEFMVDPSCELMITDFENVMTDVDGKKWVKKGKNKAGVPFEKHGHFSDTADYLLCSAFEDRFKNFGVKIV